MNSDKKATLNWILKYNRTPYPYSPQNAALKGMEPKQPGYFDGKYYKQLKWKDYQDWGSIDENLRSELIKVWHGDDRVEGIGCNAGWNGESYFSMVDFDRKNFESLEAMEQAVMGWENRNPGINLCPRIRTQSGGYRCFVGFESIPETWGNTISFTFTPGGEKSLGDLMVGPGGLGIILGKGLKGNYVWDRNPCGDIPVFQSPESIGLYKFEKAIATSTTIASIYDTTDTPELAREALNFIPVSQFDNDYRGWINLGMACQAAGLDFEDWDHWSRGSTKYTNSKETFNHWKTFKDGGGITPGTLFKFAKDNGWNPPRRNNSGYQKPLIIASNPQGNLSGTAALKPETQSNVIPINKYQQQQFQPEDIEEKLKDLAEKNLPKSKLRLELNNIAKECNINPKEIENTYREICSEIEDSEAQTDLKTELDELLKNKNQSLNLSEYLPGNLAKISEFSTRLCLRPELGLTAFLSVISSLQNVNNDIYLLGYTDFDQPLGLFNAICAEPSQKKSPLINKIATEPLRELQREARKIHEQELIAYESLPEDQRPPEKPVERAYFAHTMSQAGMRNLLNAQSKKGWGILILCDELAGNFKNNKKAYNDGATEDLLSAYDAFGKREYLKDGWAGDYDRCLLSILGGIQPEVMREFNNGADSNGKWARFNYLNQPTSPFIIPDNPPAKLDIKDMLADFYRKIAALPQLNLRLSSSAEKAFTTINNKCERYRVGAKTQALAAQWGKMPGKIGRLAALIHIIHEVALNGTVQSLVVEKPILDKAVKLARFYLGEASNLYGECSTENKLAPQLAKILELAEKRQTAIGARDIKAFDRSFTSSTPDDIRGMFIQLSEMGHGALEGSGTRLKFKTVDNCRQTVDKTVDNETIAQREIQPIVDIVDKNKKNILEQTPLLDKPNPLTTDNPVKPVEVEILSTVSTVSYNSDGVAVPASTELSTNCLQLSTVDCSERSPDPTPEPEPLDFDYIKEGDILFDGEGNPHRITGRTRQLWETHRKQYISRNDVTIGQYHRATVEDITRLLKRTIKAKNKTQAKWLCEIYGGDSLSLMARAIDSDDLLIEVYNFDDWE